MTSNDFQIVGWWEGLFLLLPHYCLYSSLIIHSGSEIDVVNSWIFMFMGHGCGFLGFVHPQNFFPTQGNGSDGNRKRYNPMGFFHSIPWGREWEPGEPLDLSGFPSIRTAAIPQSGLSGIWIGATSAFQQRLAQLWAACDGAEFFGRHAARGGGGWRKFRTFEVFVALYLIMGVESRETLGIGEYTEMGFTSENVSLPDGRRFSLCSTGNYAQDRAGVAIALRCCR